MAHFLAPRGLNPGYDIDNKLASGSVWRLQIPVGQRREILLSGGQTLTVTSNNPGVVPNDGFRENICRADGLRSLSLLGQQPGTSLVEARRDGNLSATVQVRVGTMPPDVARPGGDLEIVLSPMQLAAVLEGTDLNEAETRANRFYGALQMVGGALELVGAAALLLVPEPTMVTKVAGGVLTVHGSDTAAAGLHQLISGRPQTTLTFQAAEAAARAMGMDPSGAIKVGMAVDIGVPLVAGFAGAARVAAIRRGTINLLSEEAQGGHTIARHVARTEAQLQARLAAQPGIKAASTFVTIEDAEKAVSAVLKANRAAIKTWASTAKIGANSPAFTLDFGKTIGQGVVRATGAMTPMSKAIVVLRKVSQGNRVFFVLTSYPAL
jgi:hypothetical protein